MLHRRVAFAILLATAATLASFPVVVHATEEQMLRLPTFVSGCLTCHDGSSVKEDFVPEGTAALVMNPFGDDWTDNGKVWDAVLALLNSDNDGCTNGFELGDPKGKWRPGAERPDLDPAGETHNPGAASDCALPIDSQSWGVLKALFGD